MPDFSPETLHHHGRALRRLAVALVGPDASDDVVQDAWVVALRRPDDSENRPHGRGWLRGVVRNRAREHRRATRRRREHEGLAHAGGPPPSPASHAEAMDAQRAVADALHALPEPYRLTLWLRYFAGKRTTAIAQEMDVPAATVRTRIKRGLERLREQLDGPDGRRSTWRAALLPLLRPAWPARITQTAASLVPSGGIAWPLVIGALAIGAGTLLWRAVANDPPTVPDPVISEREDGAPRAGPTLTGSTRDGARSGVATSRPGPDHAATDDAPVVAAGPKSDVVRGHVRREGGGAVAGATVYAIRKAPGPWGRKERDPPHVETNTEGAFELTLDDRERWLVAMPRSDAGLYSAHVDLSAMKAHVPVDFQLAQAAELVVRVTDTAGAPVEHPQVSLIPDVEPGAIKTWPRPGEPTMGSWSTPGGPDGVWRNRLPWRGPLRVSCGGRKGLTVATVLWSAGDPPVELVLEPSAIIRVRVKSTQMLGQIAFSLETQGRANRTFYSHGLGASEYVFRDGVGAGPYTLRVQGTSIHDQVIPVHVPRAGAEVAVDVELQARTDLGHITVRHANLQQKRLPHGRIVPSFSARYRRAGKPWRFVTPRPPHGALTLQHLPAGTWTVVVIHSSGDEIGYADVTVNAGETSEVALHYVLAHAYRMPNIAEDIGRKVVDAEVEAGGRRYPLVQRGNERSFAATHAIQTLTALFGEEIGPYPSDDGTLVLTLSDGTTERLPLDRRPSR